MPRRPLAIPFATVIALLALSSCDTTGVDDLTAEARSPDGTLVARLWCQDFCDVPEREMLTIEPADRAVTVASESPQDGPRGELPADDIAAILYTPDPAATTITWTGPRTLTFAVFCPSDGNNRAAGTGKVFRDVTIVYRDSSNGAACR